MKQRRGVKKNSKQEVLIHSLITNENPHYEEKPTVVQLLSMSFNENNPSSSHEMSTLRSTNEQVQSLKLKLVLIFTQLFHEKRTSKKELYVMSFTHFIQLLKEKCKQETFCIFFIQKYCILTLPLKGIVCVHVGN